MTNPKPPADPQDARLYRLAVLAQEEADALAALLPAAFDVQWDRSLATRGERDETGRRAIGGHSDPTADIATDPGRLHVRRVLTRGEAHLEEAVVRLRGFRRGIERAMNHWEGTPSATTQTPEGTPPS